MRQIARNLTWRRLIEPGEEVGRKTGKIQYRERLGGLLEYDCRDAA
jgi:hypothetical protein